MQVDIVDQGVELMVYGMGTVVVFLTLLILVTTLMSWFIGRFFPEADIPVISSSQASASQAQSVDQSRLIAIITAAIHQHRAGKE